MKNEINIKDILLFTLPWAIIFFIIIYCLLTIIHTQDKAITILPVLFLLFILPFLTLALFLVRGYFPKQFFTLLKTIARFLPTINQPIETIPTHKKLIITLLAITGYFMLRATPIYGLSNHQGDIFYLLRDIWLGSPETLTTLGIGPVIVAYTLTSIVIGGGYFKFKLATPLKLSTEEHLDFQKFLALLLSIFFALVVSATYLSSSLLVIFQMILGAILIIYLVELMDNRGIGYGIVWLIIAETSFKMIWFSLSPIKTRSGYVGAIPNFIASHELVYLLPIILTILFLVILINIVSLRLEIPLAHKIARGARGRFPILFIQFGEELVITVVNWIAIMTAIAFIFYAVDFPILGSFTNGEASSGIIYYLTLPSMTSLSFSIERAIIFAFIIIFLCINLSFAFANATGQTPKDIAMRIHQADLIIPGHKATLAPLERLFSGYVPKILLMNGIIVGVIFAISEILRPLFLEGGVGLLMVAIYFSFHRSRSVLENIKDDASKSVDYFIYKGFGDVYNGNLKEAMDDLKNASRSQSIENFITLDINPTQEEGLEKLKQTVDELSR